MNRISRSSQGRKDFQSGWLASLLFVDDVLLLASSRRDLQQALELFVAKCEAAKIKCSTSKSRVSWKMVDSLYWVVNEPLPQV